MLSPEDNEFLTRVGRGTPMGELFRRFWLPAMLVSELPEPDGAPIRLRLLGEDLVAFRATDGTVGILDALCPHRRAHLFYGRNEENGIRCAYHGWKFDTKGACVDMPNEPATSTFKNKIKQVAYPAAEYGDLIWVYLGPPESRPELPQFEWARVPSGQRRVSKWLQDSNWAQGLEGEIDSSHLSFAHAILPEATDEDVARHGLARVRGTAKDTAPVLKLRKTDYGFVYGARRGHEPGDFYWRVTHFLMPTYSLLAPSEMGRNGRVWVPVDDHSTWTFGYTYHPDRTFTDHERGMLDSGVAFPPRLIPGTLLPLANKGNDYLIDRQMQKTVNFSGIYGVNEQDRALQESMGAIPDRSQEHLGSSDLAVIAARRTLLKAAKDLQKGIEPYAATHGEVYHVRGLDAVEPDAELDAVLAKHQARLAAEV